MNYEDRVTKDYVEGLIAGMPKIAFGTYQGTGDKNVNVTVDVGFRPKAVLVAAEATGYDAKLVTYGNPLVSNSVTMLLITDTGFVVAYGQYSTITNSIGLYDYLAIG